MNLRTIATLAVAILLGLIAVGLVRGFLMKSDPNQSASGGKAGPGVFVVVATAPIARGAPVDPKFIKLVTYPADSVPDGAFHSITEASTGGRIALRSFVPGEPILTPNVSGPGGKLTLSAAMTPGMRAVAIRASDTSAVGGFVLPGDRVDVLVTRTVGGGEEANTVTQVLAENVRVLGVDQSDNDEQNKPVVAKAITIEVTPDQAATLNLAQSVGTVSLTLRHVSDSAGLASKATTVADLGFAPRRHAEPAPAGAAPAARPAGAAGPVRPTLRPNEVEVHVTRGVETNGYAVARY
ncbi:Flp pilus assembly protein CpaB [Caulobacter sp. KR2-114]|uniref:Flp pilus assembly protein CpaB n=1 Tax=Caulobacter sp. KR2-114 TaxID=3400912 RepID=UPI003C069F8A